MKSHTHDIHDVSKKHFRFVYLAEHVATWSKDPSTKTGCVIVRPDSTVAAVGYNGFPMAIRDSPELLNNREEKYKRTIHCEMNAILSARERLNGYTLYTWPCCSCERCAVHIIQSGIAKVVFPKLDNYDSDELNKRWESQFKLAETLFNEAGVDVVYIKMSKS